jgi:hypothetical protein
MQDPYRRLTNISQHRTKYSHLDAIFVAQQPKSGLGNTFVEVFKLHTIRHTHTHTHTHTHLVELLWTSDQLIEEAAAYSTHSKHKKRTSMHSAGFEPAVPADRWP